MATEFARKDYTHSEGRAAKTIEQQTAKIPSDAFLWMAVGSIAVVLNAYHSLMLSSDGPLSSAAVMA